MTAFIDSSVLVAGIVSADDCHAQCNALVAGGGLAIYSHGLVETFSAITGGSRPGRLGAAVATELLAAHYVPRLTVTTLSPTDILRAMNECEKRGVRGGAIYDYLHLVAARKAKSRKLFTLNVRDFRSFHRDGDPEVVHP